MTRLIIFPPSVFLLLLLHLLSTVHFIHSSVSIIFLCDESLFSSSYFTLIYILLTLYRFGLLKTKLCKLFCGWTKKIYLYYTNLNIYLRDLYFRVPSIVFFLSSFPWWFVCLRFHFEEVLIGLFFPFKYLYLVNSIKSVYTLKENAGDRVDRKDFNDYRRI